MRKQINHGGRPATGRIRTVQFQAEMSPLEREYLSRKTVDIRSEGTQISQNGLIIQRVFLRGWRDELTALRRKQKGYEPDLFWLAPHGKP